MVWENLFFLGVLQNKFLQEALSVWDDLVVIFLWLKWYLSLNFSNHPLEHLKDSIGSFPSSLTSGSSKISDLILKAFFCIYGLKHKLFEPSRSGTPLSFNISALAAYSFTPEYKFKKNNLITGRCTLKRRSYYILN